MLAYHAMARKRPHRVEQSLTSISRYLKTFGLYLPCFGAIVRGNVPLAAIAKPENQETVFRSQHCFQFPVEPLHLAHRQTAAKDAVLQTPSIPVQLFIDDTPALRFGN